MTILISSEILIDLYNISSYHLNLNLDVHEVTLTNTPGFGLG